MKLQDLHEATTPTGLYGQWLSILKSAADSLKSLEAPDTSHNLGGNLSAVRSGASGIRSPYSDHGQYGSVEWDAALTIGNNIPDALEKAKGLFQELVAAAEQAGAVMAQNNGDFALFRTEDGALAVSYKYARSFCTVMIRHQ